MFPFKRNKKAPMKQQIVDLYKDFKFLKNTDILYGKLPTFIHEELSGFVEKARSIKINPYGFLRYHENEGKNSYQISIPAPWLEDSYSLAYINFLGEYYVSQKYTIEDYKRDVWRQMKVRKHNGHFDGYDFWINYSYKGDVNPDHNHSGIFSTVIYIKNDDQLPTIFSELGIEYVGKPGDILIFPSQTAHMVPEKTTDGERITLACNLIRHVE